MRYRRRRHPGGEMMQRFLSVLALAPVSTFVTAPGFPVRADGAGGTIGSAAVVNSPAGEAGIVAE